MSGMLPLTWHAPDRIAIPSTSVPSPDTLTYSDLLAHAGARCESISVHGSAEATESADIVTVEALFRKALAALASPGTYASISRYSSTKPAVDPYRSFGASVASAVRRYSEQIGLGELLADRALDGWVKGVDDGGVIVELYLGQDAVEARFPISDFVSGSTPRVGDGVRLVSHLVTAPDLATGPTPALSSDEDLVRLKPVDGSPNSIRLD